MSWRSVHPGEDFSLQNPSSYRISFSLPQKRQGMGLWPKLIQLAALSRTQVNGKKELQSISQECVHARPPSWEPWLGLLPWVLLSSPAPPHFRAKSQPPLGLWVPHTLPIYLSPKEIQCWFLLLATNPPIDPILFPQKSPLVMELCAPFSWNHE